jgi:hypothetical protein
VGLKRRKYTSSYLNRCCRCASPCFRPCALPTREARTASDALAVLSARRICSAPPLHVSCPDDGVLEQTLHSATRWRDNPWRYWGQGERRNPEDKDSGAGDGLGIGSSEWGRTKSVCVRTAVHLAIACYWAPASALTGPQSTSFFSF